MKKELTNELLALEADHAWVNENLGTLLKHYTDPWIGVKSSKIIASDPAHTYVEFITSEPLEMVL